MHLPTTDRPPFISTQRLFHLRPADGQAFLHPDAQRQWLKPETFRLRRSAAAQESSRDDVAGQFPAGAAWVEVENREAFLADISVERLCLTVDAGCGKTIAMRQAQYLRQARHPGHLAMLVNFSRLPTDVNSYAGTVLRGTDSQGQAPLLVKILQRVCPDGTLAWQLLQRKLRRGEFTLLVDALDQTGVDDSRTSAAELVEFLTQYPRARCIVSARPYAVNRLWTSLFAQAAQWEFAQVDTFTKSEQGTFIGAVRRDKLNQLEADVLVVPRALEAVRHIPLQELDSVKTAAEIYWRSLWHSLQKAFEDQDERIFRWKDDYLDEKSVLWLFSLLGFETTVQGLFDGVPEGKPFDDFVRRVWKIRRSELEQQGINSISQFGKSLEILGRLNEVIEFAALDHEGLQEIHWRSRTLQHFFAALWLTRYATADDRRWLARHVFVQTDRETSDWYEVWRAACEMPGKGETGVSAIPAARWDEPYARSMSVLFGIVTGETAPPPRWWNWIAALFVSAQRRLVVPRSTEMIFRCWKTLLQIASVGDPKDPARPLATAAIDRYLSEFRHGLTGAWGPQAQKVLRDFDEQWFVPLRCSKFWYGDEGTIKEIETPLQVAKYPVTHEIYALFDPGHETVFDQSPNSAAYLINWYDAWCVATWLHSRLLDEFEWEYACRAQQWGDCDTPPPRTIWCFGNDEAMLGNHAWYCDNFDRVGWGIPCVGQKRPNAFGLCDMHGTVCEWTSSLYHPDPGNERAAYRVLRGGSSNDVAHDCRSAFRNRMHPRDTVAGAGVRVARNLER